MNPDPARRWLAFLRNHREAIAAMDFFTVPTLTFGVLYCFFVIGHDRRKILHCNVTRQPNALWIVLQLREAWGYEQPHRFLIFDRDAKFSADVDLDRQTERHGTCPNRFSKSLAERRRRALGWECASGLARPCDRSEPATPEKIAERIRPLLPRRPDSSWAGEGHARWSSCGVDVAAREQDHLVAATRWTASPLRSRRLNLRPAVNHLYGLTCCRSPGRFASPILFRPAKLLPMPSRDSARLESTGRPTCNYSQPNVPKTGVFQFWRTTAHAAHVPKTYMRVPHPAPGFGRGGVLVHRPDSPL